MAPRHLAAFVSFRMPGFRQPRLLLPLRTTRAGLLQGEKQQLKKEPRLQGCELASQQTLRIACCKLLCPPLVAVVEVEASLPAGDALLCLAGAPAAPGALGFWFTLHAPKSDKLQSYSPAERSPTLQCCMHPVNHAQAT